MVKIHSFLFVVWHFLTGISWAMYAKRKMPGDDGDPTRRLRKNLADLFLSNAVSGSRAHTLFDDADVSGRKHMKDLVKCGNKGIAKKKPQQGHHQEAPQSQTLAKALLVHDQDLQPQGANTTMGQGLHAIAT